jgi:maltose alpha-D-glucosyltransferase/alpha-amylase
MHAALASRPDLEGFAPAPVTHDDLQLWSEALVGRAGDVFQQLDRDRGNFGDRTLGLVEELLGRRVEALEHIRQLLPNKIDADMIRHHGDLHLGQVLIVKDDAFIIDFEGEPDRTGDERRAKAPSARDVAGLIRSLDYASRAALQRTVKARPGESVRLERFLDNWRHSVTAAFYAGVREAAGNSRLWPKDDAASDRLLRFFIAEKAIYEIGYELANRPDWLAVPISGALRAILGDAGRGT